MLTFQSFASGSSGNLYTVDDGQTTLLIECGLSMAKIKHALNYNLHKITGCFVSHAHLDHCKAANKLLRAGIDVWANLDTITAHGLTGHRIHSLIPLKELTVGTFKILPFDIQHDIPALGFLFTSIITGEKLLYFTDTFSLKYYFQGITIIAAECNYDLETLQQNMKDKHIPEKITTRLMENHMSFERLLDTLRTNDLQRVKQIYLIHLSDNNSNEKRYKIETQKLTGVEVHIC